jgi:cobalt transporter subunit CbtA
MIGRLVLAALIAGMAAGVILAGIQHVRITPLILEAEVFEKAAGAAEAPAPAPATTTPDAAATTAHDHEHAAAAEWEPQDGLQRTLSTSVATLLAGAGFALALAGVSLLTGIAITPANGLLWGICGFLCVTVATGAGLPPELPGMPAGDLIGRQVWWVGTIIATGIGIYLIATKRSLVPIVAAVMIIALPHIIGAPQPPTHETTVPAGLAAEFASNTVAAAAVFWSLIGLFLGLAFQKFGKEVYAT